jgi:hypothetical protein
MSGRKDRPLRAYIVTHYAITEVTNIVAARTLKEAVEQDEAGNHVDEGWAGEATPTRALPKARRYPPMDELAARSESQS